MPFAFLRMFVPGKADTIHSRGQLTARSIAALPGRCGERRTGLISCGNHLGGPTAAPWIKDLQVIFAGPSPIVMLDYRQMQGKLNDLCRQCFVRILCGPSGHASTLTLLSITRSPPPEP